MSHTPRRVWRPRSGVAPPRPGVVAPIAPALTAPALTALWALALLVWGCGDATPVENGGADGSAADLVVGFDAWLDAGSGDVVSSPDAGSALPDAGGADAGAGGTDAGAGGTDAGVSEDIGGVPLDCPGGPLCSCEVNGDCDNAQCIETPSGKQCAEPCIDKCSDGENFKCATVESSGGDGTTICVPKYGQMCDPCSEDKACKSLGLSDSLCVDHGAAGAFCAVACAVDGECKAGFSCKAVQSIGGVKGKQCVPDAAPGSGAPFGECACSPSAVKKKLSTPCFIVSVDGAGNEGKCLGKRVCLGAGLSKCTAPAPESEVCDGVDNDCDGYTDEASCDDGDACTQDACKAGKGGEAGKQCVHVDLSGTPCNADDNVCTASDACLQGVCTPGKPKDCDDGNPCTKDACDAASGCTQTSDDGAPCDDDDACTAGEVCGGGQCLKGMAKDCSTANTCVVGACDPGAGQCKYVEQPKGTPCEDGNTCTTGDGCTTGACLAGGKKSCDDGNTCTSDACDPKSGCQHAANSAPCEDGAPCTLGDVCKQSACVAGEPKGCDDGAVCTVDACDPKTGACVHVGLPLEASPCDADGSSCTAGDACQGGKCVAGKAVQCDDGQACTVDACDPKTGQCLSDPSKLDGKGCDADGSVCTVGDACQGGKCAAGKVKDCDDGNACTDDACDDKSGCVHKASSALCDDGDACTVGDVCKAKACVSGAAKSCDDGNVCTTDGCSAKTGCTYKANAGQQHACYEGKPAQSEGKGLCKGGAATCGADGKLGACVGQVLPAPEVCDGADNNCDGATDEGCKAGVWDFSVVPVALSGTSEGKSVRAWGGRPLVGQSAAPAGGKHSVSWSLLGWLLPASGK